jgi:hypothetical protein
MPSPRPVETLADMGHQASRGSLELVVLAHAVRLDVVLDTGDWHGRLVRPGAIVEVAAASAATDPAGAGFVGQRFHQPVLLRRMVVGDRRCPGVHVSMPALRGDGRGRRIRWSWRSEGAGEEHRTLATGHRLLGPWRRAAHRARLPPGIQAPAWVRDVERAHSDRGSHLGHAAGGGRRPSPPWLAFEDFPIGQLMVPN